MGTNRWRLMAAGQVARTLGRAVLVASSFSDPAGTVERVTWSRNQRIRVDDFGTIGEYPDLDYLVGPTRGGTREHVAVLMEIGESRVTFLNLEGDALALARSAVHGIQ